MRREELVQAAISVIAQDGLAGATLATIAKRAEMSPALVNHYFDGKDELLAMALRRVSSLLRDEIRRLLPPNPTPHQRLKAIIDGNFQPQFYDPSAQEAWFQFGLLFQEKESRHLHRINRILGARFSSNIGVCLPSVDSRRTGQRCGRWAGGPDRRVFLELSDGADQSGLQSRQTCLLGFCRTPPAGNLFLITRPSCTGLCIMAYCRVRGQQVK